MALETKYIQIYWTCGSIDEARRISRTLVQEKYVACANIIPWIESIFSWKDQLDTVQETKVIFKTKADRFEDVKNFILKNGKYEVPEILKIPILDANEAYLRWIDESTKYTQTT